MKRKLRVRRRGILLLLFAMFMGTLCSPQYVPAKASEEKGLSEKEARARANEQDSWVICHQQGERTSDFSQYDAAEDCLYFTYSKHDCVDVYDWSGLFLYSIIFPKRQNGGISVRCEDNRAYICSKDNMLYIFSGAEEAEQMDYDTAKEKGYDFFWFYNNEPKITVDGRWICRLGETGDVIHQIPTPTAIKNTIPPSGEATSAIPIIGASLFLAVVVLRGLLEIANNKRRKTEIT